MNFVATPPLLIQPADITRAAQSLGCEPAALRAVIAVETAGTGYDAMHRPRMLFEPHVFYRVLVLNKRKDALTAAAKAGLAYESQGGRHYPADSYPHLQAAMQLDAELALQSASWGLGQVMGGNYKACGYSTALAMVTDAVSSEARQLDQMCGFIRSRNLADLLAHHAWSDFAVKYNGPEQARSGYATHLAEAYARAVGVETTPVPAPIAVPAVRVAPMTADELEAAWMAKYPDGALAAG